MDVCACMLCGALGSAVPIGTAVPSGSRGIFFRGRPVLPRIFGNSFSETISLDSNSETIEKVLVASTYQRGCLKLCGFGCFCSAFCWFLFAR